MFGHQSDPSRIYSFKARRPIDGLDRVDDQMRLAHRYANRLIEIERERRARTDALLRERAPDVCAAEDRLAELDQAIAELEATVKRSNQAARAQVATDEDRAQLRELRRQRKEWRARRKEARSIAFADADLKASLKAIDTTAQETARTARGESGVFWGTYLFVEQSLSLRSGAPPRFRAFRGDGTIAVQLQGGLPWLDALAGSDPRLRVKLLPRVAGRPKHLAELWMRVGSDGREPVWAVIPFHLHRHPPEGSMVKWVQLKRRRVGYQDHWEVCVILARAAGWQKDDLAVEGTAGVDLGWRIVPGGLRVAVAVGDDEATHELIVPQAIVEQVRKADSLRSIRDREFDQARDGLAAWKESRPDAPEWFRDATVHLRQWRSAGRLARVVRRWAAERFPGDEDIFAAMEAWRLQERHLADWEANQRLKAARLRDDLYRKFAARLRRRYRTVATENMNVKQLIARPQPGEDDAARAARLHHRIAAVGRLRQFLREAVAEPIAAPSEYTTLRCHVCGHLDHFDAATLIHHTCSACRTLWDQDQNAARNLLRWAQDHRQAAPA